MPPAVRESRFDLSGEVDVAGQFEPVDARTNLELQVGRLTHVVTVRLHLPTLGHQRANRFPQIADGDVDVVIDPALIEPPPEAQFLQLEPCLLLERAITQDAASLVPLHDPPLPRRGGHAASPDS